LSAGRGEGFAAPARLSWTDMRNWAYLTDRAPEPWEVQAIMAVDVVYIEAKHEEARSALPGRRGSKPEAADEARKPARKREKRG